MTLGQLLEMVEKYNLPPETKLVATAGHPDHDEAELFECRPIEAVFGEDYLSTGEYDFIEFFIPTTQGE